MSGYTKVDLCMDYEGKLKVTIDGGITFSDLSRFIEEDSGPKGQGWIYFVNQSGLSTTSDGIYRIRPDGSSQQKIPTVPLASGDYPQYFALSPDNQRIVYRYDPSNVIQIQEIFDVSSAVVLATGEPTDGVVDWSVTDRMLALRGNSMATYRAVSFYPDASSMVELTAQGDEWGPKCWSPDGMQAVVVRGYQNPSYEIGLVPDPGGGPVDVIVEVDPAFGRFVLSACWVDDRIYYILAGTPKELWSCAIDGSDRHIEFSYEQDRYAGYQVFLSAAVDRVVAVDAAGERISTLDLAEGQDERVVVHKPFPANNYLAFPTWRGAIE